MNKEVNIQIEILKNGQTQKYGDLNYEYELKTKDLAEDEVKIYCTEILMKCNQTKEEWNRDDINSYFRGYYKFEKISGNGYGLSESVYKYYVHIPSMS